MPELLADYQSIAAGIVVPAVLRGFWQWTIPRPRKDEVRAHFLFNLSTELIRFSLRLVAFKSQAGSGCDSEA
jgi:hypothetical protein